MKTKNIMMGVLAATAMNAVSMPTAIVDTTRTIRTMYIKISTMPIDMRYRIAKYAAVRKKREDEAIIELLNGAEA